MERPHLLQLLSVCMMLVLKLWMKAVYWSIYLQCRGVELFEARQTLDVAGCTTRRHSHEDVDLDCSVL